MERALQPFKPVGNIAQKIGLVLSGGGARAAYHAGVLKAISEIIKKDDHPFPIIAGFSAGAFNGAFLAARATSDFRQNATELWNVWKNLKPEAVFRTDTFKLAGIGVRWLLSLTLGRGGGRRGPNFLLQNEPLRSLLEGQIDFRAIHRNVEAGRIQGIALSATSYDTGATVTFYDGGPFREPITSKSHFLVKTPLGPEHIMASSAIPIFFPPVEIGGEYYGDGGIRLPTPLSPALHLGAERILAIGIRHSLWKGPAAVNHGRLRSRRRKPQPPTLAEIAGVLLNAIFMEALDVDVERLKRINQVLRLLYKAHPAARINEPRIVPNLTIQPSIDLGKLAFQLYRKFSMPLQYFLRGIGASNEKGWDFMSYLSFDNAYTSRLLELGYNDAMSRRSEIREFFAEGTGSIHRAA